MNRDTDCKLALWFKNDSELRQVEVLELCDYAAQLFLIFLCDLNLVWSILSFISKEFFFKSQYEFHAAEEMYYMHITLWPIKEDLPSLCYGNTHFQRQEWSYEKSQKRFLLLLLHGKDSLPPWKKNRMCFVKYFVKW